jgi:DNA segregation ATPase FtsK/SpoIIIE, S-DNA-T family
MPGTKTRPRPLPAAPRPPRRRYSLRAGLGLTLVAVLIALALALPGGAIGGIVRGLLGYGFGWGSYLVPVAVGAFGVAAIRSRLDSAYRLTRLEGAGWIMLVAALIVGLQVADGDPLPRWDAYRGGGGLGHFVWEKLVQGLGAPSSGVVVAVVGLLGLGLVLDVTIEDAWRFLSSVPGAVVLAASLVGRVGLAVGRGIARVARRLQRPAVPRTFVPLDDVEDEPPDLVDAAEPAVAPTVAANGHRIWQLPVISVLKAGAVGELGQGEIAKKVKLIEQTLAEFDVYVRVVQVNPGPTVTQFGLEPGFRERHDRAGAIVKRERIKVSEITALSNDLALALAAPSIRIEAPVPGRQVVGIEVPNGQATVVSLRQVVESTAFQKLRAKTKLALALGEDVSGQTVVADLARMPHLLIAGATGSGKSGCINAIISCLLLQATPAEVRLILIDPKRVELATYNDVPHLLRPVVVDVDKVVGVLKWVVHEMDERYKLFESRGVRNIDGYNRLVGGTDATDGDASRPQPLPFIVVIIDELADLMMLAPDDTERLLCRLAQLARATGIHLIVATQRPSVDVITGLIKANFPTRISFAVTSQIDSRTIIDSPGAEKLLGRGDMLFLPTDAAKPIRLQGAWVSDEEIDALTTHWRSLGPPSYVEQLVRVPSGDEDDDDGDELYERAVEVAREHTRISTSLLQRRLRIGYTRAARLIDLLEDNGVVGPAEGGGRSREVHHAERTTAE